MGICSNRLLCAHPWPSLNVELSGGNVLYSLTNTHTLTSGLSEKLPSLFHLSVLIFCTKICHNYMDVSVNSNEHRGLQVACALLGIVAGSIIIGVSNSSGAATVGGIFLGAAGIGLLIAIAPLLQVWQNLGPGRCRVQPLPPTAEGHRQDNEVNEVKEFAAGETAGPSSINDGSSAPAPDLISKS